MEFYLNSAVKNTTKSQALSVKERKQLKAAPFPEQREGSLPFLPLEIKEQAEKKLCC